MYFYLMYIIYMESYTYVYNNKWVHTNVHAYLYKEIYKRIYIYIPEGRAVILKFDLRCMYYYLLYIIYMKSYTYVYNTKWVYINMHAYLYKEIYKRIYIYIPEGRAVILKFDLRCMYYYLLYIIYMKSYAYVYDTKWVYINMHAYLYKEIYKRIYIYIPEGRAVILKFDLGLGWGQTDTDTFVRSLSLAANC
jgi:hypothetical protein